MTMRWRLILAWVAAGLAATGSAAAAELGSSSQPVTAANGPNGPTIDCSCLNRGIRFDVGQTACLQVGEREYTARCEMMLNNPSWSYVEEGCRRDRISLVTE
jgi:hypothetical protein